MFSRFMLLLIIQRMYSPMTSQTLTPSNAPIVTLNFLSFSLLVHMFPLLSYRRLLHECIIVLYSESSIDACFLANSINLFKSSSEIDW